MKMNIKKAAVTLLLMLGVAASAGGVYAANDTQSTGYTVTKTIDGKKTISQDAYLPSGIYADLDLNAPQDLYTANEKLYVADTGNKRVLCVDIKTGAVQIIGADILKMPTGVAADKNGKIFVADAGNSKAYRFSESGELEFTFEKPTAPSYGKKVGYKPTKIAPAEEGGAYIISEGTQAGIVHMSGLGDFLGYFASNEVSTSLFDKLVDTFLTEEQKSSFLKKTPPSFGNIFKGNDRLVYTINKGMGAKVKKHSISGINMLSKSKELPALNDSVDMHVAGDGNIFVVGGGGIVTEITADGYFLCSFGGIDSGEGRIGLFKAPSGIGVDESGNIYVLDKDKNSITTFSPSPVQANIHMAINDYQNGLYDDSRLILEDVLKFNNTSYFAHIYSAKNYMQQAEYELAAEHYKIANDKDGYSEAYWEIRNIWLQDNLIFIIAALLLLAAIYVTVKIVNKKTKAFEPIRRAKVKLLNIRLIKDLTKVTFAMKHPIDNAYDVKILKTGGYLSAAIIYAVILLLIILYQTATGFIFAQNAASYSIVNVVLIFLAALLLFIIGHHLISDINDGLGTLRGIFVTVAYSCSPIVLFLPIIIILSNFSTVNESFFLNLALYVVIFWSICNMIVGLIEIHDYKFSKMLSSLLITVFAMAVAVIALSIGYLLLKQIFGFIYEIVVEVRMRV